MGEQQLSRARRRLVPVDGHFEVLTEVRVRPSLWVVDDVLDAGERATLIELGDRAERSELDVDLVHDGTGASFEMTDALDPVVGRLVARLERIVGLAGDPDTTLRFRRYRRAERHPLHVDNYELDGRWLVATALVGLTDVDLGGETAFPLATPGAAVVARPGRLVLWFNHLDDGEPDPLSLHEGAIVRDGEKTTITLFLYGPAAAPRRRRLVEGFQAVSA